MTRRTLKPYELHFEKAVLFAAAVFAIVVFCATLLDSPNRVRFGGAVLNAAELDAAVLRSAEDLQQRVRDAVGEDVAVPRFSRLIEQAHGTGLFGVVARGGPPLPRTLRSAAPFGEPIDAYGFAAAFAGSHEMVLIRPLPPSKPVASAGRSIVRRAPGDGEAGDELKKGVELGWITVAAFFDVRAHKDEATRLGYPPFRATPYVASVEVQRQTQRPDGTFTDWTDVTTGRANARLVLPAPILDDETGMLMNKVEVGQAFASVKRRQEVILQPVFHAVVAGDRWRVPPLDGIRQQREAAGAQAEDNLREARRFAQGNQLARARELASRILENLDASQDTVAGARRILQLNEPPPIDKENNRGRGSGPVSPESPGRPSDEGVREAVTGPTQSTEWIVHPETGRPAVWVHDETVAAGKTYRYHVRVNLWNRYVGRSKALRNPEGARRLVLNGEWSPPSDPVAVVPRSHFFVRGPLPERDGANVEVWRWWKGKWIRTTFAVGVGDVIGWIRTVTTTAPTREQKPVRETIDFTTGVVVVDLQFDEPVPGRVTGGKSGEFSRRMITSLVMSYLDPVDGQVIRRIAALDRHSPTRRKLQRP